MLLLQEKVYVFSGKSPKGLVNTVDVFDPETKKWQLADRNVIIKRDLANAVLVPKRWFERP